MHIRLFAQRLAGAHEPPQSTSAPHTPPVHSAATPHFFPLAHFGQLPPQFRSVSVTFWTASVHDGAAHVLVVVPLHTPDWQSPATPSVRHFLPLPHLPHIAPPQSTSVSLPSVMLSMHVAAAQPPPAQPVPVAHSLPGRQGGHSGPPQSTSVSVWFRAVSMQVGAAQVPRVQTRLVQSPPVLQWNVGPQPGHEPPQVAAGSVPVEVV